MTVIDLQPYVQAALDVVGTVAAALIVRYVPRAISAFEAHTGIQLDAQQQAALTSAVQTAAGAVETKIDQGVLSVAHVNVSNDTIATEAQAILLALPGLAATMGLTKDGLAKMIVGAVDTGSRTASVAPASPAAANANPPALPAPAAAA